MHLDHAPGSGWIGDRNIREHPDVPPSLIDAFNSKIESGLRNIEKGGEHSGTFYTLEWAN